MIKQLPIILHDIDALICTVYVKKKLDKLHKFLSLMMLQHDYKMILKYLESKTFYKINFLRTSFFDLLFFFLAQQYFNTLYRFALWKTAHMYIYETDGLPHRVSVNIKYAESFDVYILCVSNIYGKLCHEERFIYIPDICRLWMSFYMNLLTGIEIIHFFRRTLYLSLFQSVSFISCSQHLFISVVYIYLYMFIVSRQF